MVHINKVFGRAAVKLLASIAAPQLTPISWLAHVRGFDRSDPARPARCSDRQILRRSASFERLQMVCPSHVFNYFLPVLVLQHEIMAADVATSYCKCICEGNTTVIPILGPTNAARPCLDCNQQFCVSQSPLSCVGTHENEISVQCFQKDVSFVKDEIVVVFFVALTGSLLLYATIIKGFLAGRRNRQAAQYNVLPSSEAEI